MKYIDEFRDSKIAKLWLDKIHKTVTRNWKIMEICGGQTHTLIQYGIDQLLPPQIEMLHGPGCPVCVTPIETIDKAIEIAKQKNVIFTSFGDMLRVPGSNSDLLKTKSQGADIRIVYSPLEASKIAMENPNKEVVFFAIGFETTAPGNAMAIVNANRKGILNFSELVSHYLVPSAMKAILSSSNNKVNGFLAAGHVCTIMGYWEYENISKAFKVPIVPTGFEPIDMLQGIFMVIKQLEEGKAYVENQYTRSARREGNASAQDMLDEVFKITDNNWRGIGFIPKSGMKIRDKYKEHDAEKKFDLKEISVKESELCISGSILQGNKKPVECSAFGKECSPLHPLGATMVSNEGTCAAYYKYQRFKDLSTDLRGQLEK